MAELDYRRRIDTAAAFLEGRTVQPIDRAIVAMQDAAVARHFERAARWRERFEQLEWLLAATARSRAAVDLLTFVYRDPGDFGDDRAYLVRQGVVARRVSLPHDADRARSAFARSWPMKRREPIPPAARCRLESIDEILLMTAWFRAHPDALRRTTPFGDWMH